MAQKKRIILQPEYVKEFNCIGSACEDTCCADWIVNLDKKTYLSYKKIIHPELKPIIGKMINRKHNEKDDATYGKIKMDSQGRCPFLNEKNLCKFYSNLGENYLSNTCTFYPRVVRSIDGNLERSLTMSCPHAAKLALLNPDGIIFEHIEEDSDKEIFINSSSSVEQKSFLNKLEGYFWDIRIFSLNLLQNRNYDLAERLIILGVVYKKIEELYTEKRINDLPTVLNNMTSMIESGDFKEELKKIPTSTHIQMTLAKRMTHEKVLQGIRSERYIECLRETAEGLGDTEEENLETILEKYETNYKEYLSPYLKEKEYILENYIVNEYFKEMMPFGSYKTIWDSYIFICVLYGMVKLHMIGMAGYHKGLNDDITLKLIQSLSKVVLHNNKYIQGTIKLLKDNEYDSLAYMAILVKN